jgi:hypothetical protein
MYNINILKDERTEILSELRCCANESIFSAFEAVGDAIS